MEVFSVLIKHELDDFVPLCIANNINLKQALGLIGVSSSASNEILDILNKHNI